MQFLKKEKLIHLTLIMALFFFFHPSAIVYAEDTYTCKANNVSKLYCSFLTESRKEQYGCTITETSSGCSGTCTNLTKEDIEKFGSKINVTINDCTKNGSVTTKAATATKAPTTTKSAVTTSASNTTTTPTVTVPNNNQGQTNENNDNPGTGTSFIMFVFLTGIIAIVYATYYYQKMVKPNMN